MAQVLYGTLVGNVTDPSGAAVPGADVKITHIETTVRAGINLSLCLAPSLSKSIRQESSGKLWWV